MIILDQQLQIQSVHEYKNLDKMLQQELSKDFNSNKKKILKKITLRLNKFC